MTRELDATILIADGTARAIADRDALETIGPLAVRGKREPFILSPSVIDAASTYVTS